MRPLLNACSFLCVQQLSAASTSMRGLPASWLVHAFTLRPARLRHPTFLAHAANFLDFFTSPAQRHTLIQ